MFTASGNINKVTNGNRLFQKDLDAELQGVLNKWERSTIYLLSTPARSVRARCQPSQ